MYDAPLVSILLPVFDAAETLDSCLRSVRRQTLAEWECIVVDDGSTDASRAIARRTADGDARFRLIERPHEGIVGALNAGLAACRGRFVARMDADDVMHRERLARQAAALEASPATAAVGCHVRLFPRDSLGAGMRRYERWLASVDSPERLRAEAFVECPVAHPTLVARREVLHAFGYRDVGWPEDYDLVLRLLAAGHEIDVVSRRLVAWRHGARRLSQTSKVYANARFTECKATFLAKSFLADDDRYVLWGYGGTGKALRRALERRGKRPAAIVELHPRRLGNTILGAPVIGIDALRHPARHPLLVSVAGGEARELIRAELARKGFRETTDYFCAA